MLLRGCGGVALQLASGAVAVVVGAACACALDAGALGAGALGAGALGARALLLLALGSGGLLL